MKTIIIQDHLYGTQVQHQPIEGSFLSRVMVVGSVLDAVATGDQIAILETLLENARAAANVGGQPGQSAQPPRSPYHPPYQQPYQQPQQPQTPPPFGWQAPPHQPHPGQQPTMTDPYHPGYHNVYPHNTQVPPQPQPTDPLSHANRPRPAHALVLTLGEDYRALSRIKEYLGYPEDLKMDDSEIYERLIATLKANSSKGLLIERREHYMVRQCDFISAESGVLHFANGESVDYRKTHHGNNLVAILSDRMQYNTY